jgi:hypothetical protein
MKIQAARKPGKPVRLPHKPVRPESDEEDVPMKHYEEEEVWVPPSGQTGDGRTALNDKYGY